VTGLKNREGRLRQAAGWRGWLGFAVVYGSRGAARRGAGRSRDRKRPVPCPRQCDCRSRGRAPGPGPQVRLQCPVPLLLPRPRYLLRAVPRRAALATRTSAADPSHSPELLTTGTALSGFSPQSWGRDGSRARSGRSWTVRPPGPANDRNPAGPPAGPSSGRQGRSELKRDGPGARLRVK